MNTELSLFIREALLKEIPRKDIRKMLLQGDWPVDEVDQALRYYLDVDFPVPVPSRRPYASAQETYMYLLMFLTLYISSFSLGTLLFQYINQWFPDPLSMISSGIDENSISIIRWSLASIIVAYPIFLWVISSLNKAMEKSAERRTSRIRKWLTYFTLFIAAAVVIIDSISLLFNFFRGELTIRFGLKFFVVVGIAGAIFSYYLISLHKDESNRNPKV